MTRIQFASPYDAEGRRTQSVDRAGRTNIFAFDSAGRLSRTTYPDGAYDQNNFDSADPRKSPPIMHVRITAIPPGDAPDIVRAAWVGLVLPLARPGVCTVPTISVLSCPKTWAGLLLARLTGKAQRESGYVVDANRAVEILASRAPEAAKWWRENAASAIRPGKLFVFASEVCRQMA